jgi:hypothetical protein
VKQSVSPAVAVIIIIVVLAIVAAAGWKLYAAKGKGGAQKPTGPIDPDEIKAKRAEHKGGGPPIGADGKTPAGGTPPMAGGPMMPSGGPKGGSESPMQKGGGMKGMKGMKGGARPTVMPKGVGRPKGR